MLSARPVQGAFRRLRWGANGILMAILLSIPWIRIGGEPLILLDVPGRKFHVFGLVIFPQELYFLWLILAALALSLFFFTSLAGRLWCGWACPQTVFTDLFAWIAARIEGWTAAGRPRKVATWRVIATHALWLGLSGVVAFHLVGYFRSPYVLLPEIASGDLLHRSTAFWLVMTGLTYVDFGLVRQTFCKYLCPYARFQSVLFDRDTLVVAYDERRGEPRGKRGTTEGDCVDCRLCVEVCPTGIDIRQGLQLECIACTQCIDACNGVMARLDRPSDLIGYASQNALEGVRATRLVRPRVLVYGALLASVAVVFTGLLLARRPLDLHVRHNANNLYQRTADGRLGNAYTLRVENRDRADRVYRIQLEPRSEYDLIAGLNPLRVPATTALETRVFVVAKHGTLLDGARRDVTFVLEELEHPDRRVERRSPFVVPSGSLPGGAGR